MVIKWGKNPKEEKAGFLKRRIKYFVTYHQFGRLVK